jgi:hypothetical protein
MTMTLPEDKVLATSPKFQSMSENVPSENVVVPARAVPSVASAAISVTATGAPAFEFLQHRSAF